MNQKENLRTLKKELETLREKVNLTNSLSYEELKDFTKIVFACKKSILPDILEQLDISINRLNGVLNEKDSYRELIKY